jgi:L-iditol 2-dehydrogenase
MRAIEFHGDERAELVERPDLRPGEGELLLEPIAVGFCGTDVEIYEGSMAYYRAGLAHYPVVPGHEWVAEVVEVGEGVDRFQPGDRIVGECSIGCGRCAECRGGRYHLCAERTETGVLNRDGAMATQMLFPASSGFALPDEISSAAAALVEPTAVALNAVRRTPVAGRTVLVVGAGAIGLLAAQCARAEGADAVLVGDPVAERRAVAERLGFDAVLPLGAIAADDVRSVRECVGGAGVDVVLVCAAAPSALALAFEAVRPAGSIVIVALFGRSELPLDVDRLVVRDLELHGILGSPNLWPQAISMIASGAVDPAPLVSTPLSLSQAAEAMESVREGPRDGVKVLIDPRQGNG